MKKLFVILILIISVIYVIARYKYKNRKFFYSFNGKEIILIKLKDNKLLTKEPGLNRASIIIRDKNLKIIKKIKIPFLISSNSYFKSSILLTKSFVYGKPIIIALLNDAIYSININNNKFDRLTNPKEGPIDYYLIDKYGKTIYFLVYDENNKVENLCSINIDGSSHKILYSFKNLIPVEFSLSPDNKKIVFSIYENKKEFIIYTAQLSNMNIQKRISSGLSPCWSPKKGEILFFDIVNNSDIWLINEDGSGKRRVTNDLKIENRLSWSLQGTKIAFLYRRVSSIPDRLCVIDYNGSNKKILFKGYLTEYSYKWIDDSNILVYSHILTPDYFKITTFIINSLTGKRVKL